jgi:YD repeat-containing protein
VTAIPAWQAATAGHAGQAGAVNQFLGAHTAVFSYGNALSQQQATGSAKYSSTQGQYLAQQITTSATQTQLSAIALQISTVGGSAVSNPIPALQVGLYANAGGVPTGAALATASVSCQYVYSEPFWVSIPLSKLTLTPSTTYHLVVSAAGDASHYYVWQRSNKTSGASTSANGTSWTAQGYGLMYQTFVPSTTGAQLQLITEDDGASWTSFAYDSLGQITTITRYTAAQDPNAPLLVTSTLTYTNGRLTGVS